jgi:hypothetical protein
MSIEIVVQPYRFFSDSIECRVDPEDVSFLLCLDGTSFTTITCPSGGILGDVENGYKVIVRVDKKKYEVHLDSVEK